jgi:hypothetical protein
VTNETLTQYRKLAESHTGRAAGIILELLTEMEKLRRLKLRTGMHPIGAMEPWPYEPHVGIPLAEIPEDYLLKWLGRQSRNALLFDISLGTIAQRDLKLYDYISKLATPPQPETIETSETLPQTETPTATGGSGTDDGTP